MSKSIFLKLFAAVGLALSAPAFAQGVTDPSDTGEYEPAVSQTAAPVQQTQAPPPADQQWETVPAEEYQPLDPAPVQAAPVQQNAAPQAAAPQVQGDASARASAAVSDTVAKDNVLAAAEGVFGRGAEGLAALMESILQKQGDPTAYITGSEAGGAVVVGVRYGKGMLHHKITGDQDVFWTGPSIGFDVGGSASKVFVLVYNLDKGDDLFKRYGAAEGNAFMVGGFNASYLRNGNTVLIPIRMGLGMRMGVNAGYMRFSKKNRWLPF